jgi:hypothetical protein
MKKTIVLSLLALFLVGKLHAQLSQLIIVDAKNHHDIVLAFPASQLLLSADAKILNIGDVNVTIQYVYSKSMQQISLRIKLEHNAELPPLQIKGQLHYFDFNGIMQFEVPGCKKGQVEFIQVKKACDLRRFIKIS